MCENLSPSRIRCEACRTINLAKHLNQPKPNMQVYDKCSPTQRVACPQVPELPLQPTCIKVCTKEEYRAKTCPGLYGPKKVPLTYPHGKLMYGVKAGILLGAVYFTYSQGIWGDQQDVTECLCRWQEYIRSINTRRPPVFDEFGNVIRKEATESILAPAYSIYKTIVTTCFAGVVKVPVLMKCAYVDYLKALKKKQEHDDRERKIRKKSVA
ncbi:uncharacterized protein LOC126966185 [Leptidea sinapis]|uniref:uncharacterized protein LOC126966185 n=1 Tax=Leptidea sinapis TaxID=189913 RepID=UPI00213657B3|nr:uncharacterized protein LOC126966185 [Leptidea sinapis]XP_050666104.1 uncharacterized protein LOC126966185 [Leptidea sinapis]